MQVNSRRNESGGTQEEMDYLCTIVTPLPAGASRHAKSAACAAALSATRKEERKK